MAHIPAYVFFVYEPGLMQSAGVFCGCFEVAVERSRNLVKRCPIMFREKYQNGNTAMVCNSFYMTLQLCRSFRGT